jgi:hypothetical protein
MNNRIKDVLNDLFGSKKEPMAEDTRKTTLGCNCFKCRVMLHIKNELQAELNDNKNALLFQLLNSVDDVVPYVESVREHRRKTLTEVKAHEAMMGIVLQKMLTSNILLAHLEEQVAKGK